MAAREPQFLEVGAGPERRRIAYLREGPADAARPGLVWLCGLKSEMTTTKAAAVADWARTQGLACLRFDYSGHGRSEGRFEEGTVSRWLEEAEAAFEVGEPQDVVPPQHPRPHRAAGHDFLEQPSFLDYGR